MDNDRSAQNKADIIRPLTPVQVQGRVRKLIECLNPDYEFNFVHKDYGRETTLKEDLEFLELFVKYEVLDKEAHGREMYEAGKAMGGMDGG